MTESASAEQTVAGAAPRVATVTVEHEPDSTEPDSPGADSKKAGSERSEKSDATAARSGSRSTLLVVAAASAMIALLVAVSLLAWLDHRNSVRDTRRTAEIQAARQMVLNLTTIHPDTAKQDVERILADASGEFKAEFDGRIDPFVGIVTEAKVITNGEIIEAGLEREDGTDADILVAARSMVTNGDDAQPTPRDFRLRVTITESDGRYTTSKVEFVA
ncbi:hypothetical protein SKPI104516_10275 [Skermania piniformis]